MDMDMSPLRPQNCLFACKVKPNKDYHFKVDNDVHQLSLQKIRLGAGTKDELYIAEAEAVDFEGSPLTTLRMFVQSTVSLGGFTVTPPVVLRLKRGSEPVHISRQYLVAVKEDAESEDEEDEDVKLLNLSGKCSSPGSCIKFPQKKLKGPADKDDEDDNNDDEEDDDDDGGGDDLSMKKLKKFIQDTQPKNAQKFNLNGKDSKTVNTKIKRSRILEKKQEKTPKTLKGPSSVEDMKVKMQAILEKRGPLPKVEPKFINCVKNYF